MGCNVPVYSRQYWCNSACTSVCNIAALCSFAASDSFSTSTCCLLSENWLVRVSSLVLKANSSLSLRLRSCFACSICSIRKRKKKRKKSQFRYKRGSNYSCLDEYMSVSVSLYLCSWLKIWVKYLSLGTDCINLNLMWFNNTWKTVIFFTWLI